MEIIRQVVRVGNEGKIEITIPETVQSGLVEIVVLVQSIPDQAEVNSEYPAKNQLLDLFGFLPQRVDPMMFQHQLRSEWDG